MNQIDLIDMIQQDADEGIPITNAQLGAISSLARCQQEQEQEVSRLEEALKQAKERLRRTAQIDLPEAMNEVGMTEFRLSDGTKISITETLYASISSKNKPAAANWLLENDLKSLVKEEVSVEFQKGEHMDVLQLRELLINNGYTPQLRENINTGSVKSAIKELLEKGKDVPLELFGAYFVKTARLESGGR